MACIYPSIHFSLDEDTLKITVGCPLCAYPSVHKNSEDHGRLPAVHISKHSHSHDVETPSRSRSVVWCVVWCVVLCVVVCVCACVVVARVWCVVKLGTRSLSLLFFLLPLLSSFFFSSFSFSLFFFFFLCSCSFSCSFSSSFLVPPSSFLHPPSNAQKEGTKVLLKMSSRHGLWLRR